MIDDNNIILLQLDPKNDHHLSISVKVSSARNYSSNLIIVPLRYTYLNELTNLHPLPRRNRLSQLFIQPIPQPKRSISHSVCCLRNFPSQDGSNPLPLLKSYSMNLESARNWQRHGPARTAHAEATKALPAQGYSSDPHLFENRCNFSQFRLAFLLGCNSAASTASGRSNPPEVGYCTPFLLFYHRRVAFLPHDVGRSAPDPKRTCVAVRKLFCVSFALSLPLDPD